MTLVPGSLFGGYEILSALGKGGMGEVYRARDLRLKREVALKILLDAFAHDVSRLVRFQREAEVLAALNHPNIAAAYGLEESDGRSAIVLELVEGVTLAERVAGRPLAVGEALGFARQIVDALDAAQEKAIVHRDLKPANIKITPEGRVKVLDFGLAKVLEPVVPSTSDQALAPTLSAEPTRAGVILGTPFYMSPEQARGRPVDHRTDIWAFGCIVYEMLTGRRLFGAETFADAMSAVVSGTPDWSALPAETPPLVRTLLRLCVQKDPKQRLQHIADARVLLDEVYEPFTAPPGRRLARRLPLALAGLACFGLGVGAVLLTLRAWPQPVALGSPIARLSLPLTPAEALVDLEEPTMALSPAGTHVVYVGADSGVTRLYLRPLDGLDSAPIAGTEGASSPFFAPDGQSIGFLVGTTFKRVPITGGTPTIICDVGPIDAMKGVTWGTSGTIVFAPGVAKGLWQVRATGGTPQQITTPESEELNSHRWPDLLPGDGAVLFTVGGAAQDWDDGEIVVHTLATSQRRTLLRGTNPRYLPTGHLVFARGGNLMAVSFDQKSLEIRGTPVPILEGLTQGNKGYAHFSVSKAGSLLYRPGELLRPTSELVWVDRSGVESRVGAPSRSYFHPRLSPDGTRIAVEVMGSQAGVWLYSLARETLSRFTIGDGFNAIWTPRGDRLTFEGAGSQARGIYWRNWDATGAAELLTTTGSVRNIPLSWGPEGQTLLFVSQEGDIWSYRTDGRRAEPLLNSPFIETSAALSPDGRWLAFASNETGRLEVYVQAYPSGGSKLQISTEGGTEIVWARDGNELHFRNGDRMFAASLQRGSRAAPAKATLLFDKPYSRRPGVNRANYDVGLDGRFLMIKPGPTRPTTRQLVFVTQWLTELTRRVPATGTPTPARGN